MSQVISFFYNLLWGDLITIPLPGGSSLGLSLLVIILVPAGIYLTIRTKGLPFRLFPEMIRITLEKRNVSHKGAISGIQALVVSTATRVGMGNLIGVVAAISAGGAGAVFWMWIIALLGSSTAFVEATLAQLYKEKDPLYGGYRGGPAYYIHSFFIKKDSRRKKSVIAVLFALSGLLCWCGISQVIGNSVSSGPAYYIHSFFIKKDSRRKKSVIAVLFALSGLLCWCGISQVIGNSVSSAFAYYIHSFFIKKDSRRKKSVIAVLFALSGLLCWCGISQVIGNSVSSAFQNAFQIPPIWTTVILVAIAAVIVLRKNATVKVLDVVVPVMAGFYFLLTLYIIIRNAGQLPSVFQRIFSEAFGLRQAVAGGIGAVIMNGAKRGLFSNEAGSGSAPCAAAAADISHPAKEGLLQALGVFIDTLLICSCSAMIMLLTPASLTDGLEGMDLLQTAMQYHMGDFGVIFIAVILWLFSFSTFIGILFYARPNIAYLFGDNWISQTLYKLLALAMLFVGGLAAYRMVWDLGDVGVGLMTVFNMIVLIPLAPKALASLKDYEENHKKDKVL